MIRRALTILPLVAFAIAAVPRQADAGGDEPPCAAEANAVRAMKRRDPSLRYPTKPAAVEHVEAGKRAFGVQQYDRAIEEYTAAGLIDDAPLILYNLGQTYRAAREYAKAIRQYTLFLERGKPGRELRALIECHVGRMQAELDAAASTAPPTGPAPDQRAEPPAEPAVEAGDATGPDDRPAGRFTTRRKISIGVGVAGVVAVGIGAAFHLKGRSLEGDAAALCPMVVCSEADEANRLARRADANYRNAAIVYGIGAAAVAGAAFLWFTGAPERPRPGTVSLAPRLAPTFAGIDMAIEF